MQCLTISALIDKKDDTAYEITAFHTKSDAAGDYISAPTPSTVTIQREQERVCSNIIINDDIFVEATEEFTVSLVTLNTTFSAGVSLMPDNANIYIEDNDGKSYIIRSC